MKILKLHIRDKHTDQLNKLSNSVNFVWNYVNGLRYKHLQKTGKFFSAYDIKDYPNLRSGLTVLQKKSPNDRKGRKSNLILFLLTRKTA